MSRGLRRTGTALAVTAALAAALAGCRREPTVAVLEQAWKLAAERRVDAALPLVKDYLIWHPDDAAAHYVLGQCHLHRPDVNTTVAKGEFETALHHFAKHGNLGILAPDMTAELFQSALHRDIALALMRALYEGDDKGVPGALMYPVLDQALRHVKEALRFDPASEFLLDMERSLEELRQGRPSPAPLLRPAAKPAEITI